MKEITIIQTRFRIVGETKVKEITGTIDYLKQYFSYTLDCGRSWQYEKGNQKVPEDDKIKSGKSLVRALNIAEANRSRSYQGTYYELKEA